jgi:hypothetical protein
MSTLVTAGSPCLDQRSEDRPFNFVSVYNPLSRAEVESGWP